MMQAANNYHIYLVNGIAWMVPLAATIDHLGLIPSFLHADEDRPATEQFNDAYQHGGGWRPSGSKFRIDQDKMELASITYPEDDQWPLLGVCIVGDKGVYVFQDGWVAITDMEENILEVCRMD